MDSLTIFIWPSVWYSCMNATYCVLNSESRLKRFSSARYRRNAIARESPRVRKPPSLIGSCTMNRPVSSWRVVFPKCLSHVCSSIERGFASSGKCSSCQNWCNCTWHFWWKCGGFTLSLRLKCDNRRDQPVSNQGAFSAASGGWVKLWFAPHTTIAKKCLPQSIHLCHVKDGTLRAKMGLIIRGSDLLKYSRLVYTRLVSTRLLCPTGAYVRASILVRVPSTCDRSRIPIAAETIAVTRHFWRAPWLRVSFARPGLRDGLVTVSHTLLQSADS